MFEVDIENLTQMEFPEVKIVAESSKKTKFQNNANEDVDFEIEHIFVIFEQAAKQAVKLDWLIVVEIDGNSTTKIEHYGHKIPTWTL